MSAPTLDVDAFVSRLEKLYGSWQVGLCSQYDVVKPPAGCFN